VPEKKKAQPDNTSKDDSMSRYSHTSAHYTTVASTVMLAPFDVFAYLPFPRALHAQSVSFAKSFPTRETNEKGLHQLLGENGQEYDNWLVQAEAFKAKLAKEEAAARAPEALPPPSRISKKAESEKEKTAKAASPSEFVPARLNVQPHILDTARRTDTARVDEDESIIKAYPYIPLLLSLIIRGDLSIMSTSEGLNGDDDEDGLDADEPGGDELPRRAVPKSAMVFTKPFDPRFGQYLCIDLEPPMVGYQAANAEKVKKAKQTKTTKGKEKEGAEPRSATPEDSNTMPPPRLADPYALDPNEQDLDLGALESDLFLHPDHRLRYLRSDDGRQHHQIRDMVSSLPSTQQPPTTDNEEHQFKPK
jgi:hypothetical protein